MRVVVVLNTDGSFYQRSHRWQSLDVKVICHEFEKKNIPFIIIKISELPTISINTESDIIWYSSHQVEAKREYIKDIIGSLYLKNKEYKLIPSYELLLCHENKGMQELIKVNRKIDSLNGTYSDTMEDENLKNVTFPIVLKFPEGAGSSTVFLLKQKSDYSKKLRDYFKLTLKRSLKSLRFLRAKEKPNKSLYKTYFLGSKRHILQPFVQNLKFDYKVLIFGDQVFVLKRLTRKGDFRASGSGLFEFDTKVPNELLDFAYGIFKKLSNPFVSLDVCTDGSNYYLIEFQGVSFGPVTMLKSNYNYVKIENGWDYIKKEKSLEEVFVDAILQKQRGN